MANRLDHLLLQIQEEISEKKQCVQEKERYRKENWSNFTELDRNLCNQEILEAKNELNTLQSQRNDVLVKQRSTELIIPKFGERPFTCEEVTRIQQRLCQNLEPEDVSTRQAGGRSEVAYLETHKAIEIASEIFGFDIAYEIKSGPSIIYENGNSVCSKAIVRVSLKNGCFHEEVGVTSSNLPDKNEAIKCATKGSVSDAVKRCLTHFGNALGLCLRDKEWVSNDLGPSLRKKQKLTPVPPYRQTNNRNGFNPQPLPMKPLQNNTNGSVPEFISPPIVPLLTTTSSMTTTSENQQQQPSEVVNHKTLTIDEDDLKAWDLVNSLSSKPGM